jgi:hypothetical protein
VISADDDRGWDGQYAEPPGDVPFDGGIDAKSRYATRFQLIHDLCLEAARGTVGAKEVQQ